MSYVLNFDEVDKESLIEVGGKNASLGEMIKVGIRVPPGFAVTTKSYFDFITTRGLKEKIFNLLSELDVNDVAAVNEVSAKIRDLIEHAEVPENILMAISEAYSQLCETCGVEAVPVAVRSSATAEDLPTASFAGQQDTYLWIQGKKNVLDKVRDCWGSLFAPRAITYRVTNNFAHEKVLISVGVQKMVNSKAAGVMFTLNPTNGDPSKVVIEGSWGLGETVVSGTVTPDKFVVDKILLEINEKTISRKHIQCVFNPEGSGTVDTDISEELQMQSCLEEEEIRELVKMAKLIEAHYGRPMDIEWAIDKDLPFPENVFIVQARPETVWSQRAKEAKIGKKSGRQLLMEQAMKRIKIE